MSNQAHQITAPGTLTLASLPALPSPPANHVNLRIHATSLNYRDLLIVNHDPAYPLTAKPSLIPGSDAAGIITAVGPDSKWKVGDRVVVVPNTWVHSDNEREYIFPLTLGGSETDGVLRRSMLLSDDRVFRAPKHLSLEEAATLYTAGVTAYRALFTEKFRAGPGVRVLTQGTGGVSSFAIQLAAAAGATVIATSSSEEKLVVARELGAKELVNYHKFPNWAEEVKRLTNGEGVDLVVEVVGPGGMGESLRATAFGGVICVIGILDMAEKEEGGLVAELLFGAKTLRGQLGAGSREMAEGMVAFMEEYDLHPLIAQTFEFEQASEALEALANLKTPGKIVVRC